MRRKGAKSEKCVEKEQNRRSASKRCKIGEVRRKGAKLEKCVEKEQIWRSASKRCKIGEVRRKGAIFLFQINYWRSASKRCNLPFLIISKEKCVEKEQSAIFMLKKREVRRKGAKS